VSTWKGQRHRHVGPGRTTQRWRPVQEPLWDAYVENCLALQRRAIPWVCGAVLVHASGPARRSCCPRPEAR